MRSRHPDIRTLLKANPDGMTVAQIAETVGATQDTLYRALKAMPDTYIDRWTDPIRGQYQAVWGVVTPPETCPPENCPRP